MMKKENLYLILIVFSLLTSCLNSEEYVGSTYSGFSSFPETEISAKKAIEISEPYLDQTFQLRKKGRDYDSDKKPVIWVTLKDEWFYIVKDNYPSYSPGFYVSHSVKIHAKTGEVIEPE